MTLIVGTVTGLIAVFVTYCTKTLLGLKLTPVYTALHVAGGPSWRAFLIMLGFNLSYVTVANGLVWLEPLAAGSGIPEIKSFLNGIDLPRVVRVKTLLCKVLGVMFSVAAGLPAGKEGPMVHSGSVVAAGISQGKSNVLGFDTSFSKFQDFRNDREKRDFVACGAAAGVAAAFGAPIGGVLFSLEEGASFWSTKLTWRAFFCAMMTVFTLYAVKSTQNLWGQQDLYEMFSFGEFDELEAGQGNFSVWELWLFILVGCMGGLIGACFNRFNQRLSAWRRKHVCTPFTRLMEVLGITFLMTAVCFVMPMMWGVCTPKPVDMEDWTEQARAKTEHGKCERTLVNELVAYNCDPDTEYNEVASLFLSDADTAIRQLFHFRESGRREISTFSSGALFVFFVPYTIMGCLTYGIAVPSGLFVPSLLSGAAFGRLCGHLLHKLDDTSGTFADSGTYALIGAAACLGGMARMTISLTVIILEATGDMQYVLPLMLTLMAARWVGNVFNEGLYDMHIHGNKLPFLEDECPSVAKQNDMTASQAMSRRVRCLRPLERAGAVFDTLSACQHDCFPVVDDEGGDVLVGTILRKCLMLLLHQKAFGPIAGGSERGARGHAARSGGGANANAANPAVSSLPLISWGAMERIYPRYPTIESIDLSDAERRMWMDLRPYVNTAPYVINESASLNRTYRLFRTLGLRHLCVVNHHNQVVGIVTRKDLLPEHLAQRLAQVPRTRVWDPPMARRPPPSRGYGLNDDGGL
ncbi:unnamed protein product [Scytosiphon promiscuus]